MRIAKSISLKREAVDDRLSLAGLRLPYLKKQLSTTVDVIENPEQVRIPLRGVS